MKVFVLSIFIFDTLYAELCNAGSKFECDCEAGPANTCVDQFLNPDEKVIAVELLCSNSPSYVSLLEKNAVGYAQESVVCRGSVHSIKLVLLRWKKSDIGKPCTLSGLFLVNPDCNVTDVVTPPWSAVSFMDAQNSVLISRSSLNDTDLALIVNADEFQKVKTAYVFLGIIVGALIVCVIISLAVTIRFRQLRAARQHRYRSASSEIIAGVEASTSTDIENKEQLDMEHSEYENTRV